MDDEKATAQIGFRTTEARKAWLEKKARESHRSVSEWLNAAIDAAMEDRVLAEDEGTTAAEARRWRLKFETLREKVRLLIRLLEAGKIKQPIEPGVLEEVIAPDAEDWDS